jgi:bile acid:Na+ symporter, BASS family
VDDDPNGGGAGPGGLDFLSRPCRSSPGIGYRSGVSALDHASFTFSPESLRALNLALAILMLSVALFLERRDLQTLRQQPRALVAGLAAQWLLLPALTLALVLLLRPPTGIALGMLLVAACPGGNVSNYLTLIARGNVALGVGLTTISTLAAALTLPLLFALTAGVIAQEGPVLRVDAVDLMRSAFLLIVLPIALGLLLRWRAPRLALALRVPLRRLAGAVLIGLIAVSLVQQREALFSYLTSLLGWVVLMHALATAGGYALAALAGLAEAERRTLALETGIQNAGLGLVLIFTFFDGQAVMALVAATWGVWHLIGGGLLALVWSRRPPSQDP